jgi:hypothetical protein
MRTSAPMSPRATPWLAVLAALLFVAAPRAGQADTVLPAGSTVVFSQSGFISGLPPLMSEFDIPFTGTLTIQLVDLGWPEFASLSFMMTSGHGVLAQLDAPGTFTYELDAPGRFFGFLTGEPQPHDGLLAGSYLLQISMVSSPSQPVALPAAIWLLLSGLVGLGAFRGRFVAQAV